MRKFIQALCLSTASATMVASASAGEFTAKDLANEEGKFAAFSVKNGMRAAFLEFFGDLRRNNHHCSFVELDTHAEIASGVAKGQLWRPRNCRHSLRAAAPR